MLNHPSDKEGKASSPYIELAIYLAVILSVIALPILILGL